MEQSRSVGRCAQVEIQVPVGGQELPQGGLGHSKAMGQAFLARPSQWPVAFSRSIPAPSQRSQIIVGENLS